MDHALLGKKDELQDVQLDEARKRGATSPAGIFALLGELDYYFLVENLTRSAITAQQLTTPTRWWIFTKGTKLASIVGVVLLMVRFALLASGKDVAHLVKIVTFTFIYGALIFAHFQMFMKYITFVGGATWTAVKYATAGFSVGLVVSETLKSALLMVCIHFKPYVAAHWYGKSGFTDTLLEIFYIDFARSLLEELLLIAICYAVIIYFWIYFRAITKVRLRAQNHGKPYDLIASS